jgi:hypothetical protein
MKWPAEIVAAFNTALEIEPAKGYTRDQVLQALLDETARRAVWRAGGDPERLGPALRTPYTPLGSVVPEAAGGRAASLTLHGAVWGRAVDLLHDFLERNAAAVCADFRDQAEPYDDHV